LNRAARIITGDMRAVAEGVREREKPRRDEVRLTPPPAGVAAGARVTRWSRPPNVTVRPDKIPIARDRYLCWIAVLLNVNTTGQYVLNRLIVTEAVTRFGTIAGINVLLTIVWLWVASRIAREHRRRTV
jgi:hypothetical protein